MLYCNFSAGAAYPRQDSSACRIIIFFLVLILTGTAWGVSESRAQQTSIQGIVTDGVTGQPLEGANILLQNISTEASRGAATDANGFYQIGNISSGTYYFRLSFVGYRSFEDTLSLSEDGQNEGGQETISVGLQPDQEILNELVIDASGSAAQIEAGYQQIYSSDLGRVPTPAGSGDLASYLQSLPGVVTTGDRGGQLYVRGGTPSQNMVLVDGTLIYQPFHILGFFSAFPEDLIASTDFYAGGFGPEYSGRISSVIDVNMRDGNRNKAGGSASLSPFLGELIAEGPLKRGKSSWIASLRGSLIEQTSPALLGEKEPLRFDSQYLKMSFFGKGDSRCSLMGMRTFDRGKLSAQESEIFRWSNFVAGGQCVVLPKGSDLLFDISAGFSYISNDAGGRDDPERTSNAKRFNLDINFTQYSSGIRFDYGGFLHVNSMNYDMSELFGGPQSGSAQLPAIGVHLQSTIPIGDRINLKPGVVLSYHRNRYPVSLEPRFRFSWQRWGDEDQELHGAVGLYRQPIAGITDKRDAGSVFTAWLPVPVGGSQMQALHALMGWKQSLGSGFNLSAEGYYKKLRTIPVPVWSTIARFTTDLAKASGNIYGGDIRLDFNRPSWYALIGYGYSWTQYKTSQEHFNNWFGTPSQRYHPIHDRRHQLNAQLNVNVGPFSVGARWQYGSGLPFTRPLGFDELLHFDEGVPNVKEEFGDPRVIHEKPYQGRMPPYHRLDISIERSFELPFAQLNLQGGMINSYNRRNLFYYDVYKNARFDQLPLAPYVSLKLETR